MEVAIYAFDEPGPNDRQVEVKAATRFKYPAGHGPMDCEALFVHKGWAYLISKDLLSARLYRVRLAEAKDKDLATAEFLGTLPGAAWITAADITPDGRHLAALSYTAIHVYDLPLPIDELVVAARKPAADAETPATQAATTAPAQVVRIAPRKRLANLRQAEAICWILDRPPRRRLLITNEQRDIYRVRAGGQRQAGVAPRDASQKRIAECGLAMAAIWRTCVFGCLRKKRARQCLLKALPSPFALVEVPSLEAP